MSSDDEMIRCGSLVQQVRRTKSYSSLLDQMKANCVEGKETMTFSKEDWSNVTEVVKQVEEQMDKMSNLTPVTGPHGLCKATVCQWNALEKMREKANKDAKKVDRLYKAVEAVLQVVDNLVAEKLLSLNDWWVEQAGRIRSKVDDMKRE